MDPFSQQFGTGKSRIASATRNIQVGSSSAQDFLLRSRILGSFATNLVQMDQHAHYRETGDRGQMAQTRIQALLERYFKARKAKRSTFCFK